jgi:SAM-dependent methyltransferase
MEDRINIHQDWEKRACPTCGRNEVKNKVVYKGKLPAESQSYDFVKNSFHGLSNKKIFFSYHRCLECTQIYCPYFFNLTQLHECYKDMPDNLMGAEKRIATVNQRNYALDVISRLQRQPYNYLEFGPDLSLFTVELIKMSEVKKIYLIEPNERVHGEIQKALNPFKSYQISSTLEDSPAQQIDLCVAIHVLDHLLEPSIVLNEIHKRLSSGSQFALVIHNENSFLRKLLKNFWPPFCLQHPQVYNKETISRLLKNQGFEINTISRTKNYIKLDNLLNNLFEVLGFRLRLRYSKFWPTLPFYFGNILVLSSKVN